jgi:hypothetical protein
VGRLGLPNVAGEGGRRFAIRGLEVDRHEALPSDPVAAAGGYHDPVPGDVALPSAHFPPALADGD